MDKINYKPSIVENKEEIKSNIQMKVETINKIAEKVKLYMMIGLPSSGKSTIAKEISKSEDTVIVSSDEIRKEFGDINDQSQNAKVFEEVERRLKENILKR